MAKQYKNEGDVIPVVADKAYVPDQIVVIATNIIGVAATACPVGGTLQVIVEGHVDLPLKSGTTYLQGAKVLVDPVANLAGQGTVVFGFCTISTPAGATTVRTKIAPYAQ